MKLSTGYIEDDWGHFCWRFKYSYTETEIDDSFDHEFGTHKSSYFAPDMVIIYEAKEMENYARSMTKTEFEKNYNKIKNMMEDQIFKQEIKGKILYEP